MPVSKFDRFFNRNIFRKIVSVILLSLAIFLALILPVSLRSTPDQLKIGDVASQDIRAPRQFSYESELLTNQARDEIEKTVPPVYLPADPAISRKQIEKLRSILSYINSVRADSFASLSLKITDIQAITDINFSENTARTIIEIDNEDWESIQLESLALLEQVMRAPIRDDQVPSMRRNIFPQISFDFSESEAIVIGETVSQLIVPNSLFSNELTSEAIETAKANVEPIFKQYAAGEIIISSGEVIDTLKWEALQLLGYTQPRNKFSDYAASGLIVVVLMFFNTLYLRRRKTTFGKSIEGLSILVIFFLIFLYAARYIIPNHAIIPYLFPLAAFGLTVSTLYNYEIGLTLSFSLSLLASINNPFMAELLIYYYIPTAIAIFILGRGRRITIFFVAGLGFALSGSLIVIAYRLFNSFLDLSGATTLIGAAFVNGLGSVSLTLIFQYFLAQLLGKSTALQLMDLSRPDHPLLQELLIKAPGSYQHSLLVANLAEQAAKEISCDALLTRVGALYHDVGKSVNPSFFIENQMPQLIDTHDDLDPLIASSTITQHVNDGLKLARKHRLPPQIQAFIVEHHGNTMTWYQYEQARKFSNDPDQVDADLYKYNGNPPASKETAILMLADGCEARVRAEAPENSDEIFQVITESIQSYMSQGQLDHTNLTLNDLRRIAKSFTRTLQNTYHQRVKYPEKTISDKQQIIKGSS